MTQACAVWSFADGGPKVTPKRNIILPQGDHPDHPIPLLQSATHGCERAKPRNNNHHRNFLLKHATALLVSRDLGMTSRSSNGTLEALPVTKRLAGLHVLDEARWS